MQHSGKTDLELFCQRREELLASITARSIRRIGTMATLPETAEGGLTGQRRKLTIKQLVQQRLDVSLPRPIPAVMSPAGTTPSRFLDTRQRT